LLHPPSRKVIQQIEHDPSGHDDGSANNYGFEQEATDGSETCFGALRRWFLTRFHSNALLCLPVHDDADLVARRAFNWTGGYIGVYLTQREYATCTFDRPKRLSR
jgi:hypothetical protein